MKEIREVTTLWEDYEHGRAYQESSGLAKKLPQFVKFYEGDQWAKVTERTKSIPRPVVNIIKMICRNKKSAILSVPVKIIYRAETQEGDVDRFNRFSDYIQKELGQELLDKKAIDDAVKKGSYFYHYYWDTEAKGKDGTVEGGLRGEIIDPLNIFFSDPTQTDEQKQEWILIASRENVKSVKAKCDKGIDKDLITGDESESRYNTVEQEGDKLCTVLTRYFRKNGEVYCEKATKTVVVNKPFRITPDLTDAGMELGLEEDAPNNSLPDNNKGESLVPSQTKATLYPIVAGCYELKEGSIYGLGEVEGLIPNQKAINFNLSMVLLNSQEMAWGKYIVSPKALKGQSITNEPGQVIIDYTETMNGVRKMTEQSVSGQPLQVIDTLTQLTRVVTGSSEVMTGETIGANMSGAAIAQLQTQAQAPVEELRDLFWLAKEKQGRLLAQFYKLYYTEKEFFYEEEAVDENGKPMGQNERNTDIFNGSDYDDVEFSIVVEATSGTKATSAGDINALDVLLAKGSISPKTYFKSYPDDALSNKTKIIKALEDEEQSQISQLSAQLQRATAQLDQQAKVIESQRATVDKVVSVIQENSQLKAFIANLYSEATGKIRMANSQVHAGNTKIAETTKDASIMAQGIMQQAEMLKNTQQQGKNAKE